LLRAENTHGFGHLSKNDFMLSRSTASVWPDEELAAVMIVTGCRCDLVWHCGRNDNGDGKANHGNDERGHYNSG